MRTRIAIPLSLASICLLGALPGGALLKAQTSSEAEIREEFRQRGNVPEAMEKYKEARQLEAAGQDKEAADRYKALLESYPKMVEALNDLTYLQATSEDKSVRNPKQAVTNGEHLLLESMRRYIQRRQFRPPENVKNPFNNVGLVASFYKVTIMNTLAAAYASAGNFVSATGECKPNAVNMAQWAVDNAQLMYEKNPSPETEQLLRDLKNNLATIQQGQGLHPGRLRFKGIS